MWRWHRKNSTFKIEKNKGKIIEWYILTNVPTILSCHCTSFYYCINDPKEAKRRPKYHYFNFITSYAVFTSGTNYEHSVSLSIMFERNRRIGNHYKHFNKNHIILPLTLLVNQISIAINIWRLDSLLSLSTYFHKFWLNIISLLRNNFCGHNVKKTVNHAAHKQSFSFSWIQMVYS